jgi:hypothetical protein
MWMWLCKAIGRACSTTMVLGRTRGGVEEAVEEEQEGGV